MTINNIQHEKWMEYAIKEAQKAFEKKEVPIGAVIIKDGQLRLKKFDNSK